MSVGLALVPALLTAAVAMYVVNRPPLDAVAPIMIAALPLIGVLTIEEALAGFSDSNAVLIAAPFAIGEGLVRSACCSRSSC